jgi:hypothetical protein
VNVAISAGAANKLAFTQQPPSSAKPTVNFTTQRIVAVQDSYGNTVTTSSAAVSLLPYLNNTCSTSASGTLSQTETTTSGQAAFSGVNIVKEELSTLQQVQAG